MKLFPRSLLIPEFMDGVVRYQRRFPHENFTLFQFIEKVSYIYQFNYIFLDGAIFNDMEWNPNVSI